MSGLPERLSTSGSCQASPSEHHVKLQGTAMEILSVESATLTTANDEESTHLRGVDLDASKSYETIVTKGFGNFTLPLQGVHTEVHKFYPPRSNASYKFDYHRPAETTGDIMTSSWKPSLDGLAFVKEQLRRQKRYDQEALSSRIPTLGERIAKNITWDKQTSDSKDELDFIGSQMTFSNDRATFVQNIDDALERGSNPFVFCERCKQRHIPWGPPLSLEDRDTCLSMLPEWFPAEQYEKPWEAFIGLCNEIVRLNEIEKGWAPHPDSPDKWGKNYHGPSIEWRLVGRREGWWKCRTGKENGESDVPEVEKTCRLCHVSGTNETIDKGHKKVTFSDRKRQLEAWIERRMKEVMKKDQEFIIKKARERGH